MSEQDIGASSGEDRAFVADAIEPSSTVSTVPASIPCVELWPVFEFRPSPNDLSGTVLRYADGQWLPDDGEYDLAFIAYGMGPPRAFYVDLPYQKNIVWSGLTTHWTGSCHDHPRQNPWHYMLRDGEHNWGGDWGRDKHLNARVGREAMSKCCSMNGCANGRGVHFEDGDKCIKAGLLRERETGRIVVPPERRLCMYCGTSWEAAAIAIEARSGETAKHGSTEGKSAAIAPKGDA